jgi:hypothetical protein
MAILGTQDTTKLKTASSITPTLDKQKDSKLHDEYSIIGRPNIENKPVPSLLDTDGIPKLTSNLSGGEKLNPNSSILDTDFEPSLTSNLSGGEKLNKISSTLDIDITPIKYVDNLPR